MGAEKYTVVVDAHAMIECLLPELLLCIIKDRFREWAAGEGNAVDRLGLWCSKAFLVTEEGGDITGLGGPAMRLETRGG